MLNPPSTDRRHLVIPVLLDTSYLINRMYDYDEVHDRQAVLALSAQVAKHRCWLRKLTSSSSLTVWGKITQMKSEHAHLAQQSHI